jgi:hypothetical protein
MDAVPRRQVIKGRTGMLICMALWFVCACTQVTAPFLPLICEVGLEAVKDCSGVHAIERAELNLETSGHFTLVGHYAACHQVEDVQIAGTYEVFLHDNGADVELLATTSTGGFVIQNQPRTIGLINLDTKTLEGRFTDTAALIRSRGQLKIAPALPMQCRKKT